MTWAALLLAAALLVTGDGRRPRTRARAFVPDSGSADPLAAAAAMDVLAACLTSGMAVGGAAAATAPTAPRPLSGVLGRAAEMLALGADPATAWADYASRDGSRDAHVDAVTRLARRSAASGAALATGVADLADQSRQDAADAARAAGERASVLIAGPLGLCYLPAFLCLGIVPVVLGLAGDVLNGGLM